MYKVARSLVAEAMRHLYQRGLVSAFSGNVSVRVSDSVMVITQSGVHRRFLGPGETVVMKFSGEIIEGGTPSSEWRMHAAIYMARKDVKAIVHSHPRHIVALYKAGGELRGLMEVEIFFRKGIARVERLPPGTWSLAKAVAEALQGGVAAAVLVDHGFVAVGKDVWEAVGLTETAEEVAEVLLLAGSR